MEEELSPAASWRSNAKHMHCFAAAFRQPSGIAHHGGIVFGVPWPSTWQLFPMILLHERGSEAMRPSRSRIIQHLPDRRSQLSLSPPRQKSHLVSSLQDLFKDPRQCLGRFSGGNQDQEKQITAAVIAPWTCFAASAVSGSMRVLSASSHEAGLDERPKARRKMVFSIVFHWFSIGFPWQVGGRRAK